MTGDGDSQTGALIAVARRALKAALLLSALLVLGLLIYSTLLRLS